MNTLPLHYIGAAFGLGAKLLGTQHAPSVLQEALIAAGVDLANFSHVSGIMPRPQNKATEILHIAYFNQLLAHTVTATFTTGKFPVILGGDHSIAIGTWAGVVNSLAKPAPIGMLWMDAHLDAHTFATTPSGRVHGMPVAVLLGQGEKKFLELAQHPIVDKQHLVIFGARSFEAEEHDFLRSLGVRIFYNDTIQQQGLAAAFKEALAIVQKAPYGFGLSLDLDVLDPIQFPAVGSPERQGLDSTQCMELLQGIVHTPNLLAIEVVEYQPSLDANFQCRDFIVKLLQQMCGYR